MDGDFSLNDGDLRGRGHPRGSGRDRLFRGTIRVSNLSPQMTVRDLVLAFQNISPIQGYSLHYDSNGSFEAVEVVYELFVDALRASWVFNNQLLDGRQVNAVVLGDLSPRTSLPGLDIGTLTGLYVSHHHMSTQSQTGVVGLPFPSHHIWTHSTAPSLNLPLPSPQHYISSQTGPSIRPSLPSHHMGTQAGPCGRPSLPSHHMGTQARPFGSYSGENDVVTQMQWLAGTRTHTRGENDALTQMQRLTGTRTHTRGENEALSQAQGQTGRKRPRDQITAEEDDADSEQHTERARR